MKAKDIDSTEREKVPYWMEDKPPKKRHNRCQHYFFIDSGYGECHYLPPVLTRVKLFPLRYKTMYPLVAWCDPACSKFKEAQDG